MPKLWNYDIKLLNYENYLRKLRHFWHCLNYRKSMCR